MAQKFQPRLKMVADYIQQTNPVYPPKQYSAQELFFLQDFAKEYWGDKMDDIFYSLGCFTSSLSHQYHRYFVRTKQFNPSTRRQAFIYKLK